MSNGAIIIIAIAASGVLMMRFRKRWLAKINIAFTNRITGLFAGWLSGFGILTHVGRKSGKVHRTPVNVFRVPNGFIFALTYSSESEWVKNVLAAGGCELKTRGKKYQLFAPNVVRDPTRGRFPIPVRFVLKIVGADEYMELSSSTRSNMLKVKPKEKISCGTGRGRTRRSTPSTG
jgi:deazaflavin-dependent oxidoreductase (nitroreductase family)